MLAADSAVTLGEGRKIYHSAEKLFPLSASSSVGIMTYGNADFMGLPWEIIIKAYARKLGDGKFDKLEQYARDFLAFVETNDAFFPDAVVERSLDLIRWGLISTLVQRHELSLHSERRTILGEGSRQGSRGSRRCGGRGG